MEVTSLCFRLLILKFILLGTQVQDIYTQKSDADFPHITPDRLQHFQLKSISFQCKMGLLRLRRFTNAADIDQTCIIEETPTGSSCTVDRAYPTDSGEYWCETKGGQRSNSVNITITAGSVILESPVLPVKDGENVTLNCRSKTTSSNLKADFYKDDVLMESSSAGEMTINNVSKSDEGLYKCSIPGVGESPGSWLSVRGFVTANPDSITSTPPRKEILQNDSDSPHVLILLLVAVTVSMMVLVLLVVGFLHLRKRRVSSKTSRAASHSTEDTHPVSGDDVVDDPNGVTYAVVVTKQRTNTDTADAADNLSLHLETNHSRNPQSEGDEDESSHQLICSAATISETPKAPEPVSSAEPGLSSSTGTLNPSAATDPNSTDSDVLYSAVHKAKKTPE
ncbi:low affinity immunoglobulin gamma Fc region receptor II-a-like [Sparus aurata]|uniref:low affinity immunoglobulin gamma Fc region receptor II-a-like n=1 Tax=Sparus aurata TaxID=8175 RepID=UPI0011C145B1|nr:low affinity immunoglobulin gamma Fc region receptor II-a-like [Sparus aurata]